MAPIAEWLFLFLIFPGLLFTVVVGLTLCWVDRKVTALVQWRAGPPPGQPFWDVLKLMGKEVIVPAQAWAGGFLSLPFVGLAAAVLAGTFVWIATTGMAPTPGGDLIVVIYLLAIPTLAVILGGAASGNPLGAVGSSRDMKLMLSYELPFVIALLVAVFQKHEIDGEMVAAGTLSLSGLMEFQGDVGSILFRPSGAIAFLVALLCAHAKLGFVPFDLAEAECEIGEGALLEYSGPLLGLFKLTQAVLLATLPVLLVTVFWGGLDPTPLGVLAFIGKIVLILVLFVLIKNTNPRVRIDQAMRFFWGPLTALALLALVLAQLGL
ncbi:MAG: NADH-quinone oxidoreductase subunit H [Planctomycetota bacterium]|nr:NADH-quinone oxidoreductase subunit H [Planctomycetota bacterium]